MADDDSKDDSVGSWPGLVDQINKTFNLVRDVFGYALPGGAFLAIGLISGRFTLLQVQALLSPYQLPAWLAFIAIVAACYPVGGVLAAMAYMPFMLTKTAVWIWDIIRPAKTIDQHTSKGERIWRKLRENLTQWLATHPTEVTDEILQIRMKRPKLLDTLDRRETLTLLAASMTTALLGGWYVFYCAHWGFYKIIVCAGIITLIQFLTGLGHLRRVAQATCTANTKIDAKEDAQPSPAFRQPLIDLIHALTQAAVGLSRKLVP
jgi:hypothetical protein